MTAPLSDESAPKFPVSVKGVVCIGKGVVLLKNERDEWELPGGKLEAGEQPLECVKREILEELGIEVNVMESLEPWVYDILGRVEVVILTYRCELVGENQIQISHEHKECGVFSLSQLEDIRLPAGYKRSVLAVLGASSHSA